MATGDRDGVDGEVSSVMGYFRAIFRKRPELLDSRSNDEITRLWLKDHPDHRAMPPGVRNTLANLKSLLRKKKRRAAGERPQSDVAAQAPRGRRRDIVARLEELESMIDAALTSARSFEHDGMADVVKLLRRARNEVVWKLGQ